MKLPPTTPLYEPGLIPPTIPSSNIYSTTGNSYYTVYVENVGDKDMPWEKRIELALNMAAKNKDTDGAEVILPPANIKITDTINWVGRRKLPYAIVGVPYSFMIPVSDPWVDIKGDDLEREDLKTPYTYTLEKGPSWMEFLDITGVAGITCVPGVLVAKPTAADVGKEFDVRIKVMGFGGNSKYYDYVIEVKAQGNMPSIEIPFGTKNMPYYHKFPDKFSDSKHITHTFTYTLVSIEPSSIQWLKFDTTGGFLYGQPKDTDNVTDFIVKVEVTYTGEEKVEIIEYLLNKIEYPLNKGDLSTNSIERRGPGGADSTIHIRKINTYAPNKFDLKTNGVVLRGPGGGESSILMWEGGEDKPVIKINNSPFFCRISDLRINNHCIDDAEPRTFRKGVIGIKYDFGGVFNTSRYNNFERLHIQGCDIGIDIGHEMGPDFTNLVVNDTWLDECRIGVRLTGANVACIFFNNVGFGQYREAGIQTIASHGSPTYVIQNVSAATNFPEAWLFDNEKGGILRVYSVRQEGLGGFLRSIGGFKGRFGDILVDVVTTAPGTVIEYKKKLILSEEEKDKLIVNKKLAGTHRLMKFGYDDSYLKNSVLGLKGKVTKLDRSHYDNYIMHIPKEDPSGTEKIELRIPDPNWDGIVIDYNRKNPLVLVGGEYPGDIFIHGEKNKGIVPPRPVFSLGVEFVMPGKEFFVRSDMPTITGHGQLHQVPLMYQNTFTVKSTDTYTNVKFDKMHQMLDDDYQVSACPHWDSGGWWMENKTDNGFKLKYSKPPTSASKVDITVTHRSWEHF